MLTHLLGAVGLFLIGMWLMTEGLKLAGGRALEHMLGVWTQSRLRGFFAGLVVTALVQSSSAITIATIGFVNASLMTFNQSVWVIFGSNVGTTLTAWLVTLFGFNVKLELFTFPLVGIGALLRVFAPHERGRALGMALAGFGLLFMGIDALQKHFAGYADELSFVSLTGDGGHDRLIGLGIGLLLTLLTHSSSASIALVLTAVAGGMAGVEMAAAAVIGANIGTTATAVLATVGATPNAKRLAAAHVLFNVLTGIVAFSLLPWFLDLLHLVGDETGIGNDATLFLALFHTSFNALGVILMWPIEPLMSKRLQRLFIPKGSLVAQTRLDETVATVPDLALRTLTAELKSLHDSICEQPLLTLLGNGGKDLVQQQATISDINEFIARVSQSQITASHAERLTQSLSTSHYLENSWETAKQLHELAEGFKTLAVPVQHTLQDWLRLVDGFIADLPHTDQAFHQRHWPDLLERYAQLKRALLTQGVQHKDNLYHIDQALQIASLARYYVEQLLQADVMLSLLNPGSEPGSASSYGAPSASGAGAEPSTPDRDIGSG